VAAARQFLNETLQAVRQQWPIIQDHMRCLHQELMPRSEVPDTVPLEVSPMALSFRKLMDKKLDVAWLFNVAAIRIQRPILPYSGSVEKTGHLLVDFLSLTSSCEKPVAMKVKRMTRALDSEWEFVMQNEGQAVTVTEAGYGLYWKCTVNGMENLSIKSQDLAL
jgi:hypothetical protein